MTTSANYRPAGFHDVNPYLVVKKGEAAVLMTFLQQAFDATERFAMRDPDGRIAHAELAVGDSVIEIGESTGDWFSRSSLHFYVMDVGAVHAAAVKAGGKELGAPVDHEYGERSSSVEDPSGNQWYIARSLPGRETGS